MWKAVIADDEGVILQGLKKLVDWTNMDVHLVGEARDGQQLKEVMEETDPDIVITDIMMALDLQKIHLVFRWKNWHWMPDCMFFPGKRQQIFWQKDSSDIRLPWN